MLIYSHYNPITNKRYIGYTTKSLEERFSTHFKKAKYGSNVHFHSAIRKYGKDIWISEIIEYINDEKLLNEREIYWINHYDSYNNGYNSTKGGDGRGFVKGRKQTEEHKRKIKEAHIKKWKNEEHPLKGRPIPNEQKEQIRKTLTGVKHTEERKANQSKSAKNRSKIKCCVCDKMVDVCNINRWHNENCKFKPKILICEPSP